MKKILLAAPLTLSTTAIACASAPDPTPRADDPANTPTAEPQREPASGEPSVSRQEDGAVVLANGDAAIVLRETSVDMLSKGRWVGRISFSADPSTITIETSSVKKTGTIPQEALDAMRQNDRPRAAAALGAMDLWNEPAVGDLRAVMMEVARDETAMRDALERFRATQIMSEAEAPYFWCEWFYVTVVTTICTVVCVPLGPWGMAWCGSMCFAATVLTAYQVCS